MAKNSLSIAAIVVGVIALLAVIGLGIYLAVKKDSPTTSSRPVSQSNMSNRVIGDMNSRTVLSNFSQASACDASNPCTDTNVGDLCMPGFPGNASPDVL
jgi:hypothetical protein